MLKKRNFQSILETKISLKLNLLILVVVPCIVYLCELFSPATFHPHDLSIMQTQSCPSKPFNVWLVSYADGEVHLANQRALTIHGINKCIDFFLPYQQKDIDHEFAANYQEILSQKRGAGYWLWKPYLINKTLQLIPEGDIIIYIDSGATPKKSVDQLLAILEEYDILLFNNSHSMARYSKRKTMQIMGMDNEHIRNQMQFDAAFMLLRNTPSSRHFVKEWLAWCVKPGAIDDTPSIDEYSDFIDHRHDQTILSLLYYKMPEGVKVLPRNITKEYFWHHHRRNAYFSLLNH